MKNSHVLNVCVNKFLWLSHENILTQKFCQVEITCIADQETISYVHLFVLLQWQLNTARPMQCITHCDQWLSHKCKKHFWLIMLCAVFVNTGHVNGHIWETVMYTYIMWILYQTELELHGVSTRCSIMKHR